MSVRLQVAAETDVAAIAVLMNAAFRGTEGERGWTTEADYITGERTNEFLLRKEIDEGVVYLMAIDEVTLGLEGCVSLRAKANETWYLGALTVVPALQNAGFGRKLLRAAEEYAERHGARTMEMTVIQIRDTLLSWYERRGYRRTGERRPFPYGDDRFGTPQRDDLEFVVLEKQLKGEEPAEKPDGMAGWSSEG